MKISKESNGPLTSIIHIQLSQDDYTEEVNKRLVEHRKKASMPGFRPGKVPMSLVKKMYGKGVMADEVNKKVSDSLNNYIVEEKLNVLGYPLPNMEKNVTIDFDTQQDFDFFFDIGLAPDFDLELTEDIKVPYYSVKMEDKELENALNDIKLRFGSEENPEKSEAIDALQGTFRELDGEGNLIEDGHENNGYFKIEDIKPEDIRESFIDKEAGDKLNINLMKAFEEESKVRSLINLHEGSEDKLDLDYQFEVEKVVRHQEAELNEELFLKVYPGGDVKTEEQFREKVMDELKRHRGSDTDKQFFVDTVSELLKLTNLEIPEEFMKRWLLESNEGKITAEQLEDQFDNYVRTMKWQLIESKLQEKYGDEVKVDGEEIRDKVRAYFNPAGGEQEINPQIEQIVDQVLQNQEESQRIYAGIQDEKYTRLFKDKLTLDEQEVDSDKFLEIASNTKF